MIKVFDAERAELIKLTCESIFGKDNVKVYNAKDYCDWIKFPAVIVESEEIGHLVCMPCYRYA